MANIPYKYLIDEEGDTFYPIIGDSSYSGQLPISKGGTSSNTASGARANLGITSGTALPPTAGYSEGDIFLLYNL